MCGRYITVQKVSYIEKKYNVKAVYDFLDPNYNVSAGNLTPVITSAHPDQLQAYCFGFSPNWGDKRLYVLNARAEGDNNKEDDPKYNGALGIISKPMRKSSIRNKRCLVIADAFIERPAKKKLKKPYLVYMRNNVRSFAMAGIYNDYVSKDTGEITGTFAIVTTTANKLMQKIGHHRSPVILPAEAQGDWLDEKAQLQDILGYLTPYESLEMNAYPISPAISNPRNNGRELIVPVGPPVFKEFDTEVQTEVRLEGMGASPARSRQLTEKERKDLKDKNQQIRLEIDGQTDYDEGQDL